MWLAVVLALSLLPQATPPSQTDGLPLLNAVSQKYAKAAAYHIEAVEETKDVQELHHGWDKVLLTAIAMPGGRYRYKGRSSFGWALLVSDGTTKWVYHGNERLYTQGPAPKVELRTGRFLAKEKSRLSRPSTWYRTSPGWQAA